MLTIYEYLIQDDDLPITNNVFPLQSAVETPQLVPTSIITSEDYRLNDNRRNIGFAEEENQFTGKFNIGGE